MADESAIPPLENLATDLALAVGQLRRRLRQETGDGSLNLAEMSVLTLLDQNEWMSISELARATSMKPQSMGTTVAQLSRAGLLRRRPHATDGRQFQFSLTALGQEERTKRSVAKREWLSAAIGRLSVNEQSELASAIALIKRLGQS